MDRHKKSGLYWISLSVILVFFAGAVIYLTTITPSVRGDGDEYIMQTVAFQNHFSFGISPDDYNEAKRQFYNNQEGIEEAYTNPYAMICDDRGWVYSNHFGAYSAIVTVVKLVLLKLGIYPLWAFSITNLILWMAAVLTVFFLLNVDARKKLCILLLIMLNPIFFYLDWVHAEMYIFAFEVIGLVFLYNKQYRRSILMLSIAAMQNIGMLPMAAIAGIAYILDCYDKYVYERKDYNIGKFIATAWKQIVFCGFFYLPAFVPIITTYLRFGVFNRVAEIAQENDYLLHKAVDYLIDPNLGILPYEPFLLAAYIILIVVGIRKDPRNAVLNLLGVLGILFIISHQKQINSGMQEIMRYCVWIIPVMIFYVVLHWKPGKKARNGLMAVTVLQGVYTAAIVSYCVWLGGAYTYLQFANWTKLLMNTAPQLYNPSHGIFYTRASGIESYWWPTPVVYYTPEGYVRKVLLSKEAEAFFYEDSFLLIDNEGNQIDKSMLRGVKVDEGDYTYYNFTGRTRLLDKCIDEFAFGKEQDTIYFYKEQYNADSYVSQGFSTKEDWGTWTVGKECVLRFSIVDKDIPIIGVDIGVCNTFYHPQSVTILVNGEQVYKEIIEGNTDIIFAFENPGTEIVELTFLLPDAVAPAEVMDSQDLRELGLGLSTLKVMEAKYNISEVPQDGIIRFNSLDYNANLYVTSGLAAPDKTATWTSGKKLLALFSVNEYSAADTIHVSMDLEDVMNEQQEVSISINGMNVFYEIVTAGENAVSFDVPYPEDGDIRMVIDIPNAVSPYDLGITDDFEEYGLMIKEIKITPN